MSYRYSPMAESRRERLHGRLNLVALVVMLAVFVPMFVTAFDNALR